PSVDLPEVQYAKRPQRVDSALGHSRGHRSRAPNLLPLAVLPPPARTKSLFELRLSVQVARPQANLQIRAQTAFYSCSESELVLIQPLDPARAVHARDINQGGRICTAIACSLEWYSTARARFEGCSMR